LKERAVLNYHYPFRYISVICAAFKIHTPHTHVCILSLTLSVLQGPPRLEIASTTLMVANDHLSILIHTFLFTYM